MFYILRKRFNFQYLPRNWRKSIKISKKKSFVFFLQIKKKKFLRAKLHKFFKFFQKQKFQRNLKFFSKKRFRKPNRLKFSYFERIKYLTKTFWELIFLIIEKIYFSFQMSKSSPHFKWLIFKQFFQKASPFSEFFSHNVIKNWKVRATS